MAIFDSLRFTLQRDLPVEALLQTMTRRWSGSPRTRHTPIPKGLPVMAQEVYAEWVGAQAKLALLEAHAECRAFAAGLPDQATNALVTQAQGPYER